MRLFSCCHPFSPYRVFSHLIGVVKSKSAVTQNYTKTWVVAYTEGHLDPSQNKAGLNYKLDYTVQPLIWLSLEYLQERGILQLFLETLQCLKIASQLNRYCLLSFHCASLRGAYSTPTYTSPLCIGRQQLYSPSVFSSSDCKTSVLQSSPHWPFLIPSVHSLISRRVREMKQNQSVFA